MRVLLCVLALCAAARAYRVPHLASARLRRAAGCTMEADACILLPYDAFPGACPALIGGEMELQELEDDEDSRTQLFLNADGTVSAGATNGPPPVATCGLWQCGETGFQMTLQVWRARASAAPLPRASEAFRWGGGANLTRCAPLPRSAPSARTPPSCR